MATEPSPYATPTTDGRSDGVASTKGAPSLRAAIAVVLERCSDDDDDESVDGLTALPDDALLARRRRIFSRLIIRSSLLDTGGLATGSPPRLVTSFRVDAALHDGVDGGEFVAMEGRSSYLRSVDNDS